MAVNTKLDPNMFKHQLVPHEGSCPPELPIFSKLPRTHLGIWRREAWLYVEVQDRISKTNNRHDDRLLVTEQQFKNLEPSIELAAILLNRVKPLLDQIYYAPVVRDVQNGQHRFSPSWKPSAKQDIIRDILPLLKQHYRISCLPQASPTEPNHLTHTSTIFDGNSKYPSFKIHTSIAQEFLAVAIGNALSFTPSAQGEAVQAVLAVTLIRELAHALWSFRHYFHKERVSTKDTTFLLPEDPCTGSSQYADLGASVSRFLFGLEISLPRGFVFFPHDCDDLPARHLLSRERLYVDGSKGLEAWTRDADGFKDRGFKLSTQTIRSFFNFYTWVAAQSEGRELPILKLLLIPDTIEDDETLPSSDDELGTKQWRNTSSHASKKRVKSKRESSLRKTGTLNLR